jgi:hypothetical protein
VCVKSPSDSDPVSRWITAIIVGALLVARRPESLLRPQLCAEDGPIFYLQVLTTGTAHTLFEPYAGYLQFVRRVSACCKASRASAKCLVRETLFRNGSAKRRSRSSNGGTHTP